ncbi:unnamed protein product [Gongylonema pulchrum]|uniref:Uncharacterized protein n=1 Tax=Gongylonema pulchrum TaxID=637853 RepID=A0A183ETL9_9BILA|nr:unnamed protein product [Gongylonema pulchrum]
MEMLGIAAVDMKTKTNTFQHLLEQMASAGVIDDSIVKNLLEKRINAQSERASEGQDMDDGRQRALAFNLSFILLTRMRFIYNDLRPSELVSGTLRGADNTQSCFYKFASQYGWTAADSCSTPITYTSDQKAAFIERVSILKRAQPFWDPRT